MTISISKQSHVGKVRKNNEDNLTSIDFTHATDHHLVLVSDGVGGNVFGEVASQTAVDVFEDLAKQKMLDVAFDTAMRNAMLEMSARRAHLAIADRSKNDAQYRGMSCTLIAALIDPQTVGFVNVGDSRLYHFSGSNLKQVSQDQTIAMALYQDGRIGADDLTTHPDRNVLQFALGVEGLNNPLEPQVAQFSWQAGDKILLCSDGLTDMVGDADIQHTLQTLSGEHAINSLIEQALAAGGKDNVTLILAENNQ
ncbi:protein phosphatase 2C domain-containing protein [uncultured Paraglaciecola sp.]|uniref:PP2C family protein-serine/threonine phosphatase n=1 Tax=uncultured Paraglaciecola sp. TaxID=1765024 RepID=UPI002601A6CB|nr:protein phosphatase 2C domain-containing protein [uncultured Paraglaciecola sp.]